MNSSEARNLKVGRPHLEWLGVMGFYAVSEGEDPDRLAGRLKSLELLAFPPGLDIIREGEPGDSIYVVFQGTAEVLREGRKLAILNQGALFGELGFLVSLPRTATVRAGADCEVFRLEARLIEMLAGRHPELMANLRSWAKERMGSER